MLSVNLVKFEQLLAKETKHLCNLFTVVMQKKQRGKCINLLLKDEKLVLDGL